MATEHLHDWRSICVGYVNQITSMVEEASAAGNGPDADYVHYHTPESLSQPVPRAEAERHIHKVFEHGLEFIRAHPQYRAIFWRKMPTVVNFHSFDTGDEGVRAFMRFSLGRTSAEIMAPAFDATMATGLEPQA